MKVCQCYSTKPVDISTFGTQLIILATGNVPEVLELETPHYKSWFAMMSAIEGFYCTYFASVVIMSSLSMDWSVDLHISTLALNRCSM